MKNSKRKDKEDKDTLCVSDSDDTEGVALDAEIDKILDEKAAKSNFSVLNVKSMIRQVVKNQLVQKMIAATVRKSERKERQQKQNIENPHSSPIQEDDEDEEEDDLFYFEPKLTRAKTKELLQKNHQLPVWPISPVKLLKVKPAEPPSETQILITQQDLPEESEAEDDEYVPKEADLHLSDDDSNSVTSASDLGSPAVLRSNPFSLRNKRKAGMDIAGPSPSSRSGNLDSVFKTPSPRRKFRAVKEAAIGLRTRSKLPLNDTALEDLEKQFIPPDVTTDMYDWTECDNTDYLQFLKNFMGSTNTTGEGEANDDDEADPEYNIMEDEEDDHDKEEHRVDRAVKVPKKELNELFAELFDTYHIGSEDELEDITTNFAPVIVNHKSPPNETSTSVQKHSETPTKIPKFAMSTSPSEPEHKSTKKAKKGLSPLETCEQIQSECQSVTIQEIHPLPNVQSQSQTDPSNHELFTNEMLETLRHQMQAHVQFLAQTYVLSIRVKTLVKTAESATEMVTSLNTMAHYRGPNSIFRAANLGAAFEIVQNKNNSWPPKYISPSPIKKRILEAEGFEETLSSLKVDGISFYEKMIFKVMGFSPAFMYPFLLPLTIYARDCSHVALNFTLAEDQLLARGLDDLKRNNMSKSILEDSKILHQYLLPARSAEQIYHRIRNVKKKAYSPKTKNPLYEYLHTGEVPEAESKSVEKPYKLINQPICPLDQPSEFLQFPWSLFSCDKEKLEHIFPLPKPRNVPFKDVTAPVTLPHSSPGQLSIVLNNSANTPTPPGPVPPSKSRKRRKVEPKSPVLTKTLPFMNDFLSGVPNNVTVVPVVNEVGQTLFYYTLPPEVIQIETAEEAFQPQLERQNSSPLPSPLPKNQQDFSSPSQSPNSTSSCSSISVQDSPVEGVCQETKPLDFKEHIENTPEEHTKTLETVIPSKRVQTQSIKVERYISSSDSEFESSLDTSSHTQRVTFFLPKMDRQGIGEETTESEDIETIFAEVFLQRAQQRIEGDGRNPALYNTFIQTLNNETGDWVDQEGLFKRVEELLKDYPDLIEEFAGMLNPEVVISTGRFIEHRRVQIQLKFLGLIEDFTPQLKSKVMQKLKALRSEIPLTKERVLTVIQSLVPEIQNPVVMDALKALFMDLFCPQSTFTSTDFEKIEMDPDDTKHESQTPNVPHSHHTHTLPEVQASSHEVVILPPEKEITATNTCPCKCHDDPNNSSFHSRSRHCEDCSFKFQGGKLFLHSGRTLKAVNIEYSSPEIAKNVLAEGNIVKPKDKTRPSASSPSSSTSASTPLASNPGKVGKVEEHLSDKEKDSKGPECKKKKLDKTSTSPVAANNTPSPASSPTESESSPAKSSTSSSSSGSAKVPWTMDDDKIIMTVHNEENDPEVAWTKIQQLLPTRLLPDLKSRFAEILEFLKTYTKEEPTNPELPDE